MDIFKFDILKQSWIIIICALFVGCNSHGPRDLDKIKEDGHIKVIMDYNPLGYYHDNDTIVGVQHAMVNELAQHLGVAVDVIVQSDLNASINSLKNGDCDLIARLIPITTELKNEVQFTEPICLDKQVLVQRKLNDAGQPIPLIKNQLELAGHCIAMPKNSPYITRLKNLAQEIGDTISIDEINNYQSEQLIILVAKGDLDYTVCNSNLAKKISVNYPQLDCNTAISFTQMHGWAVNNNSQVLLKEINNWITQNSEKYFK